MYTLARVVRTATTLAVVLIIVGILIHVLGANTSNGIVSALNDAAKWLTTPFHNVFHVSGKKANIALNWGLAALVYAIVGGFIANMLARAGTAGRGRAYRRSPAV
jgi:multisubunit Na+/H+ antiporter MnhG subunit